MQVTEKVHGSAILDLLVTHMNFGRNVSTVRKPLLPSNC